MKTYTILQTRGINAAKWLAAHKDEIPSDIRVRFDSIALLLLSATKAFLRMHADVLALTNSLLTQPFGAVRIDVFRFRA